MAGPGLQRRQLEVLLDTAQEIPALPSTAHHLLGLLVAGRLNRRDIQLAVEIDPALSARTLQLAIELGCPLESCTSIDTIFNALPLDVLAGCLLSIQIVDKPVITSGRLVRLWRHAIATGMAAQVIAARQGTMSPDAALLAGMLHDVGQIALPILMPRAYGQVLERVEATGEDLLEAERDILGVDHALFGKRLAQRWNFPPIIQSVIWLHHQAQLPQTESPETIAMVQVVRLADLLVRQEGYGYHASEPVRESTAELAERLHLSSAHAEQIGRQIADTFKHNGTPVSLDAEPPPEELRKLLASANVRLGRFYREGCTRATVSARQAQQAGLLVRLNASLASCHTPHQVLETVAAAVCVNLKARMVVPYVMAPGNEYVEGLRVTAAGTEDHFLYDVAARGSLEPPPSDTTLGLATSAAPVRAERLEGWLFDRQGPHLGQGPFYTAAMIVENRKVGGIVFALAEKSGALAAPETADVAILAGLAAVALQRVQAEAGLAAYSEELAEANRELGAAHRQQLERRNVASMSEMAAGAAHEINNPLAIISGRAQLLHGDEKNAARKEHLRTIIQQASRISDIITELRQFAMPPAPQPETVDPATLAEQAAAAVGDSVKDGPVRIEVQAPPDSMAVHVDPGQVTAALKELLDNAIQACTRAGRGTVTLTVQPLGTEQSVRFVVSDDGPGMEPNVRVRAFDPFYSGTDAGRRRGLGLPKAYRAIQASGGQMTLESTPGRGTTVRVTFRSADPASPDEAGGA